MSAGRAVRPSHEGHSFYLHVRCEVFVSVSSLKAEAIKESLLQFRRATSQAGKIFPCHFLPMHNLHDNTQNVFSDKIGLENDEQYNYRRHLSTLAAMRHPVFKQNVRNLFITFHQEIYSLNAKLSFSVSGNVPVFRKREQS